MLYQNCPTCDNSWAKRFKEENYSIDAINAIDTKSFEERIYGSSNAIWAANQYAGNKNLATSRSRT